MTPQLSVVIPVHNEAGNLLPLLETLVDVLTSLGHTFEIIVVNDGSTDATATELATATRRWPTCTELRLQKRGGQAAALLAGLHATRAPLIVTLDGDGQNDPRDIPGLLALVDSGATDVACGWRQPRHDPLIRRLVSRVGNAVRRAMLRDCVHDAGCQLRVFRREVIAALRPMELLQSFLPALAVTAGFRVSELPVRHHPRQRGRSKYGLRRLWWRPAVALVKLWWQLKRER